MISRAAVIGGGVIGAGWAARFAENGIDVQVFDPAPDARAKLDATLENADRAYSRLLAHRTPQKGSVTMAASISEAVAGADWIIESVPERMDLKREVYREIEEASDSAPIASSTSGIQPTDLQAQMRDPSRLLVAHPFNPVYLLPLVELVGGARTSDDVLGRAEDFYRRLGMYPVRVRKEIEAFIADRLLESIWREALWLIKDGICTTRELDDIVRYGFGLRYAQMGVFDTYRVAGGEAGMRHFMAQFGPCLKWPWSHLTDVPEFDDELVDMIAEQSDAQSGHVPIRHLERERDDNLIAILHALKSRNWAAGETLASYEQTLVPELTGNETFALTVPPSWADYNGHMTEARYADAFTAATDTFLDRIGCGPTTKSDTAYFTVESTTRFLAEARIGDNLIVETEATETGGKKLRLKHVLKREGSALAECETLLIHVSLATRRSVEPGPVLRAHLDGLIR